MAPKCVSVFLFSIFLFLFLFFNFTNCVEDILKSDVKYVVQEKEKTALEIFKFKGEFVKPYFLWKTVSVQLDFDDDKKLTDVVLYQNSNKSKLMEEYEAGQRIFGFLQKFSFWKSTRLYPFSTTYVGVETKFHYTIGLKINTIDFMLVFSFFAGIFLFFLAKKLARNVAAFYIGGSAVGVLLSLLIVVFILYRLIPKRSVGISMLIGGSSFTLYALFSIWQNFYTVLDQYQRWVAVYLVTVGFISFALCYRFGPAHDVRSQNLIQWSLQLAGLLMIYAGCQIPPVSLAVITALLIAYNIPKNFYTWLCKIKYRYFPPKRRFLTEEEYIYQGNVETRKALEQLREYCRSPQCDSWNLSLRLESPRRFASFVSGGSHLSDEELLSHNAESLTDADDDDEVSDDTDNNGELVRSAAMSNKRAVNGGPYYNSLNIATSSPMNANRSRYCERFSSAVTRNQSSRSNQNSYLLSGAGDFVDEDDDD